MTGKIYVLHENNEWTAHLQQRLDELRYPYELWHVDEGICDLAAEPPQGVFYNRMSASSHTRGHRYAPEYASTILAWLERHGRRVVNGSRALELEISKARQYMALNQIGISTPRTIVATGRERIIDAAEKLGMSSFITKHNRAGKGQGVQLFHSLAALRSYVDGPDFEAPIDGVTLVQQYIKSPSPHIIRHEFIGGKFFYGVRVDTSEGFELCPADACAVDDMFCPTDDAGSAVGGKAKFEILNDYRPEFIDRYEAFLQANAIEVAGIEAIEDAAGNIYTYDINTNTNYNSDAESAADRFAMLELACYLGEQLAAESRAA